MCTTSMYWALNGFSSLEHVSQRQTKDFLFPWMWSVLIWRTSSSWVRNSSPQPLQWQFVSKKTPPSSFASVVSAKTVSLLVLLLLLLDLRLLFLALRMSLLFLLKQFCLLRLWKSLTLLLALWLLDNLVVVDNFPFWMISSLLALCVSNFIFIFLICCVWDGLSASADVTVIALLSTFRLAFFELDELSFCAEICSKDSWEMKRLRLHTRWKNNFLATYGFKRLHRSINLH